MTLAHALSQALDTALSAELLELYGDLLGKLQSISEMAIDHESLEGYLRLKSGKMFVTVN
jgi:hypothetical protein